MKKPSFPHCATALAAAAVLLAFALPAAAQSAKAGDAAAGEKKVDMCIGCHNIPRYQASFPIVYKVPMIAGQNPAYIVAALGEYKKGERRHPGMRAIAASLSEQDMADVAAYYEKLGKIDAQPIADKPAHQPSPEVAALLTKAACVSCHGENFSKPIAPAYPKLAGQYEDYLYAALTAYQTEHNPLFGRSNAIMMGMARPFTHPEIKAIAAYLSSLPSELKTVSQSRFR